MLLSFGSYRIVDTVYFKVMMMKNKFYDPFKVRNVKILGTHLLSHFGRLVRSTLKLRPCNSLNFGSERDVGCFNVAGECPNLISDTAISNR